MSKQADQPMLERWKGYMVKAIAEMMTCCPVQDPELDELQEAIAALPTTTEKWNPEDRPYQAYFQNHVNWKVDILGKLAGTSGKFAKNAWTIYRYALSMIRESDADEDLLNIGKLLESVAETAIDSVRNQNADSFYITLYDHRNK